MKKLPFKNIRFVTAAFDLKGLPEAELSEVALVGRSNVGKSSLINHLLGTKCAKTARQPGKTQSINFYTIDDTLSMVDLPGYGYAKISKKVQAEWGELIDGYLSKRSSLKLLLLLIDSRRSLTQEDKDLIEWASFHKKPLALILTKTDKLNQSERHKLLKKPDLPAETIIPYSIKDESGKLSLRKILNEIIN